MSTETSEIKMSITDLTIDLNKVPEYTGAKEKQLELVKLNPYVEIVDSTTFEEAKKYRTALRQGRYELQNGEKAIASKLTKFRAFVKEETESLIAITLPHEEKQQKEIERYEAAKQAEKEEKERIERNRIEGHKSKIIIFREEIQAKIRTSDFQSIQGIEELIISTSLDVEEFQEDLELVKQTLLASLNERSEQLREAEQVRLEREKLIQAQRELDELRRIERERITEEQRKLDEQRKAQEQQDRVEREQIAAERAELERMKREQAEKEAAKLEEERQRELAIKKEADHRESLIQKVMELSPKGNRADAEAMSTSGLENFIKKVEEVKEKQRQEALKTDKEKALAIVKSLAIDYRPEVPISDLTLNLLIADFIGEADALMRNYIKKIELI